MKKNSIVVLGFAILLLTVIGVMSFRKNEVPVKKGDGIKWLTYEEAVKLNAKKKKKIFIDVYTDWCGWCKKMDATTMKDPKIVDYVNEKFYAVKLDAESETLTSYQGQRITESDLSVKVFRATGYPTTVYLDGDENILSPVPGFLDVNALDKILHFFGEDKYKSQTWEQFQQTYVPEN